MGSSGLVGPVEIQPGPGFVILQSVPVPHQPQPNKRRTADQIPSTPDSQQSGPTYAAGPDSQVRTAAGVNYSCGLAKCPVPAVRVNYNMLDNTCAKGGPASNRRYVVLNRDHISRRGNRDLLQ
ncbi:hypothetical protein GX51_07720 [Blastomyces parvus]|uniref:Uncharacterized protein n=1 Tax=Blastomyces parvus TaxID=2060905 RepID=A0A2B7WJH3_9EURO|nr:hypothetical protein GX51_07720 [Blastomyces parvus]